MGGISKAAFAMMLVLMATPAYGQFTILDNAQDAVTQQASPAPAAPEPAPMQAARQPTCGTEPLTIARMSWPSASLLADIHALILSAEFDCEVRIIPGELGATTSSMASTGQPSFAPEVWINRIADVWNGAMDAQMVRSAAPTFAETSFEGWYAPLYVAERFAVMPAAAGLSEALPALGSTEPLRFISCPIDWACSIINRNLIRAHGLDAQIEIVEPANRFEMDRLIAEAVNRREDFLFYYWQPNAILAQLDFVALDMGSYDEAAAKCLAGRSCADPQPSAFAPDQVVIAVAERVFANTPAIAAYLQRASLPLAEMDQMLAQLNVPGATSEAVAERFVRERADLWNSWTSSDLPR